MGGWELHVYFREDETSDMIKAEYVWDGWRRWWGKKEHGSQTSVDSYVMLRSSDPTTHLTESHHGLLTRKDLTVYKDIEFYLLCYFWLHRVFVAVCRLSLVAVSRGFSLVMCRLLIAVASLVVEHRLWDA